jgi:hypothetical protein
MRRRAFISLLGSAAAWPLVTQPTPVSVERGPLRLFGEVCHRMRRPRTTRIAP